MLTNNTTTMQHETETQTSYKKVSKQASTRISRSENKGHWG